MPKNIIIAFYEINSRILFTKLYLITPKPLQKINSSQKKIIFKYKKYVKGYCSELWMALFGKFRISYLYSVAVLPQTVKELVYFDHKEVPCLV